MQYLDTYFYQTQLSEFRNRLEAEMIGTAGQKRVPARTIIEYPLQPYIIQQMNKRHRHHPLRHGR